MLYTVTWIFAWQGSGWHFCLITCLNGSMNPTYLWCLCRDFQKQTEEVVILHSLYSSFTRLTTADRNEGHWFPLSMMYESLIIPADGSRSIKKID